MGVSRVEAKEVFHANIGYTGFDLKYRFLNHYGGSPFLEVGGGLLYHTEAYYVDEPFNMNENLMPFVNLTAGYEWLVRQRTGVSLSVTNHQLLQDNMTAWCGAATTTASGRLMWGSPFISICSIRIQTITNCIKYAMHMHK